MFTTLAPARALTGLVQAYWFVQDLPGDYEGQVIRTSPIPGAVLSVNMGRPNATDHGQLVPSVSLLGLQSAVRHWHSWSETYFVMAMLTVAGCVRLFPHSGPDSADSLLDLGGLTGDGPARSLARDVSGAWLPERVAEMLDRWLIARLVDRTPVPELAQLSAAHRHLQAGASVQSASDAGGISRRQLHRWFDHHLGVGPNEVAALERMNASLRSVQSGQGDAVSGFSDQAHQIRHWRRQLRTTPGAYRREPRSELVGAFALRAGMPAFYL